MARLYIGNLPHASTEHELQTWLEEHGFRVESVQVIRDLETGSSRGFAFAELPNVVRASEAIDKLNGQRLEGHNVRVSEARPVNLNNNEGRQGGSSRSSRKRAS
jgi:RNA recognition motif-containing protein